MAASTRKLEANRLNATKSTGPKTATGKAVVKYSAVKDEDAGDVTEEAEHASASWVR